MTETINQKDVTDFFNRLAPKWDEDMIKDDKIIDTILENAGVNAGKTVLDVACGTGVLIPYYLDRQVKKVTAIDISEEMIKLAEKKFEVPEAEFICADASTTKFDESFDCIMIYNAFPHFPNPDKLIASLCQMLKPGGTLSIAHGMSREKLALHHTGEAAKVSIPLPECTELAEMFPDGMETSVCVSDDSMYQVVGKTVKQPND